MVFFYKYGLFEASENDFIDDLIGVLIDSLVGTFWQRGVRIGRVLYQHPDGIFHILAVVNTLTHAAHRPARLRTCCLRGCANAYACVPCRCAGRRSLSSARVSQNVILSILQNRDPPEP